MTKPRAPHTYAEAMTRVAGLLTFKACATLVRKSDRLVRKWSEDDNAATPTLAQAEVLDLAYIAAGGEGAPFRDTFGQRIGIAVDDALASQRDLAIVMGTAMKEAGEAFAAGVPVIQFNCSPSAVHHAVVEAQQAGTAFSRYARMLARFLPNGAGPIGISEGGTHG